ncbi:hypothetical protein FEF34_09275 [Streptomyces marianii]|uniref:Gliding motility protein n=1 Tax=Streptomyces marianii TaxID=1817406 RepID=A0A5R9E4W2_9ACTN|nr:hypothetical protein FEF34_09275 [Streptomyces marianii]
MGVFARFRRKAKGAVAASTEEDTAGRVTAGPEECAPGEPAKDAVKVNEPVEASADEAAGSVDSEKGADEGEAATGTGEAPAASGAAGGSGPSDGSSGADQVEIPKQQSVDEAADNGAGEGARK